MFNEHDLTQQIQTLNNEYKSKCKELLTNIEDKETELSQLQTKKNTQTTEDLKQRLKYKRLLNLKNIFTDIDNHIEINPNKKIYYQYIYNKYAKTTQENGKIILFNQINVNKIDKKRQTISDYTRKITIIYDLNTDKFTVNIYRIKNYEVNLEYESLMETIKQGTIKQGTTARNADEPNSFIIDIPEQTSNFPLMTREEKENTYLANFNVSEFCTNIKVIFSQLKRSESEFTGKIKTIDEIIRQFVSNNLDYIDTNNKYINTNDTILSMEHPFNNITINGPSWTYLSINRFFKADSFLNYNTLFTVPSPVQYYIKKLIAQTLFSDLPSDFKYQPDKKVEILKDYDSKKVKALIDKPDYIFNQRFDQDELIFTGKVNGGDKTIKAILISSYSDKDQLYIVDHELNVYTLEGSAEFVAAAQVEPPAGGKRSRRKRRKISKKKKIKTRIKKKSSRIKKKTRKRVETRKR